jgi:hypothetical protein
MENLEIKADIPTVCLAAPSFPDGVMMAFDKLLSLLPAPNTRRLFGISRPDRNGTIMYKAAAEESVAGEAGQLGLESFTIPRGQYSCVYISNFMDNIPQIGATFRQLLSDPGIDPGGFCLEMYIGDKDVRCLVKLK